MLSGNPQTITNAIHRSLNRHRSFAFGFCFESMDHKKFALIQWIIKSKRVEALLTSELHLAYSAQNLQQLMYVCISQFCVVFRDECRTIFLNYLTNYSPGKRLEKFIEFFVSQLNYELQHGRESSLKFIQMIISKLQVVSSSLTLLKNNRQWCRGV